MPLFHTQQRLYLRFRLCLVAGLISLVCSQSAVAEERFVAAQQQNRAGQQRSDFAQARVLVWEQLMNSNRNADSLKKLRMVNDFFNRIDFVNDIDLWGKEDYWATPLQMLTSNGGDCEDYSIAKYFTLRKMGIPAERMRLTYVKALKLNQAHMVLTYYPAPDVEPLILDNLVNDIQMASSRKDLLPVYSFNSTDLWLATKQGADQHIGRAGRLSRWQAVIARINDEKISLPR